jgi:hypothetical protein
MSMHLQLCSLDPHIMMSAPATHTLLTCVRTIECRRECRLRQQLRAALVVAHVDALKRRLLKERDPLTGHQSAEWRRREQLRAVLVEAHNGNSTQQHHIATSQQ